MRKRLPRCVPSRDGSLGPGSACLEDSGSRLGTRFHPPALAIAPGQNVAEPAATLWRESAKARRQRNPL